MIEPGGKWIDALLRAVTMLERLAVPYQVVGGAAAALYGVERPVRDVDLYVPSRDLQRVAGACGKRLIRLPDRYLDEYWDVTFLAFDDLGVRVEIAGADAAYRERRSGTWHAADIAFADATRIRLRGRTLSVIPVDRLCEYKRRLDRPVDRIDCAALDRAGR